MIDTGDIKEKITSAQFVAAVRILECVQPEKARLGQASRLKDEPVRLSQNPSLGFQASSLSGLEETGTTHAFRLFCNCMGLLGSNGPLPIHYTEHALQRAAHHNDPTFREFVDLFNHRMLSLFYRAIADSDPAINLDRDDDNRYADFVASIGGFLPDAARSRDSLPAATRFNFAGWLGARTRCPEGLIAIVGGYFDLPCDITEFVGGWLKMPEESLIRLGSKEANCHLGVSTYAGRRVWSSSHKIRIKLGPMTWQEYRAFAPGEVNNIALQELVLSYLGDEIDWELQLELKAGEARPLALNSQFRLGFNGWLSGSDAYNNRVTTATRSREQLKCGTMSRAA